MEEGVAGAGVYMKGGSAGVGRSDMAITSSLRISWGRDLAKTLRISGDVRTVVLLA